MANYVSTEKKNNEGMNLLFYSNAKSYVSGFDECVVLIVSYSLPFIIRDYPVTFRNAGKSPLCCYQVYPRIADLKAVL